MTVLEIVDSTVSRIDCPKDHMFEVHFEVSNSPGNLSVSVHVPPEEVAGVPIDLRHNHDTKRVISEALSKVKEGNKVFAYKKARRA